MPIRIGIVGAGKIATDQHVPVLKASSDFHLLACASRQNRVDGIANFTSLTAMLAACPELEAVAICTPPQQHYRDACDALKAGKHVLLEKPPCTTTSELDRLIVLANETAQTLFQSWHSQFAPGVDPARDWLKSRIVRSVRVTWQEDARRWHPGQTWLWEAGGFGVFDPGINAISVLTKILPEPFFVTRSRIFVPENCQAPIAAEVEFATDSGAKIFADFDFRQTGPQIWEIEIEMETDGGSLKLSDAGAVLAIDGRRHPPLETGLHLEYAPMYRHFAALIGDGKSDVDARPFRLVADAFMASERHATERFDP